MIEAIRLDQIALSESPIIVGDPEGTPMLAVRVTILGGEKVILLHVKDPYPGTPQMVEVAPEGDSICLIAGGIGLMYSVPDQSVSVRFREYPILTARWHPAGLVVLGDNNDLAAYLSDSLAWRLENLSSDGIEIIRVEDELVIVQIYSALDQQDIILHLDLHTGHVVRRGHA